MRVLRHIPTGMICNVASNAGHEGPDWEDLGELPAGWNADEWCFDAASGTYVLDTARAWERLRAERAARLRACDWTQLPDIDEAARLAWQPYRQALRDLPDNTTDPFAPIWPTPPA